MAAADDAPFTPLKRTHYPASVSLTGLLFTLIFFESFPDPSPLIVVIDATLTLLVIAAAVVTVGVTRTRLRVVLLLGVLATIGFIVDNPSISARGVTAVTVPVFFWTIVGMLTNDVFRSHYSVTHRLLAALNLYVLAALGFAYIYAILDSNISNSFSTPSGESPEPHDLIYFAFVTQTTLGYGDITPAGRARAIALFQSTLGVLYLAVVVAAIIGESVTQQKSKPDP